MNEDKIDRDILQFMLTYYRNKCYQLEYEFLLFKGSTDKQIKTIQSVTNSGSNPKDSSKIYRERKSDASK